jgi:PPM family protein phosphatase
MTGRAGECRRCAAPVCSDDRFCGRCGAPATEVKTVAVPGPGHSRAEIAGLVLITDRGLDHPDNEDAAAAGIVMGAGGYHPAAMAAVVCDGVSTSGDAASAAVAASTAGADAMLAALAAARPGRSAVIAGLTVAAEAAAAMRTNQPVAPSCTYTAAAVLPGADGTASITVGNVGDSRAYWLPHGGPGVLLTADDSVAWELIDAGLAPESEAVQAGAHTLTRWLGADAGVKPWSESAVKTVSTTGPGTLVLCTDGLWNYLPASDDIAKFFAAYEPAGAARELVDYALRAGGQDNITVAVIPIGGPDEFR